MADKLTDIARDAKEAFMRRWEDGEYDDIPVVEIGEDVAHKVSGAMTSIRDVVRRAKDGYDGFDVWELGSQFAIRVADLIDESLRLGSWRSLDADVDEASLAKMSHLIRAHAHSSEGLDAFGWPSDLFGDDEGQATIREAYDAIDRGFSEAWDAFCEAFLVGGIAHTDMRAGAVRRFRNRLSGTPDATDLEAARITELRRLVGMLREYCEKNHGVPFDYAKKGGGYEHLVHYPKGWKKDIIPLEVTFWGNDEVIGGQRTVKEVGADYVLFIADLVAATSVIESWANWLDGRERGFDLDEPSYAVASVLHETGDGELFRKMEERLTGEFRHVWHWLGTIVMTVWI